MSDLEGNTGDKNNVTQLSDEHWCLTQDVRDIVDIPKKGKQPSYRSAIERGTNSVQSWWRKETGKTTLPTPQDVPELLQEATAWYAASELSFRFTRNHNQPNAEGADRTATAERYATKKFKEWKDSQTTQETTSESGDVTLSRSAGLFEDYGGEL